MKQLAEDRKERKTGRDMFSKSFGCEGQEAAGG